MIIASSLPVDDGCHFGKFTSSVPHTTIVSSPVPDTDMGTPTQCWRSQAHQQHHGPCTKPVSVLSSTALIRESASHSGSSVPFPISPFRPQLTASLNRRPHKQCSLRNHPLLCPGSRRPHGTQRHRPPLRRHPLLPRQTPPPLHHRLHPL